MLVFLDESGDVGRKVDTGSSQFFVVGVVFFDKDEAQRCDNAITELRRTLGKPDNFEFHFSDNSKNIRQKFIETIAPFEFGVMCVAVNKKLIQNTDITSPTALYRYACTMVMANTLPYLKDATLVIDKSGSKQFQTELRRSIRVAASDFGVHKISKMKSQDSHKNNLIQVADYLTGIVSRKITDKKDWQEYYRAIEDKVVSVQEWPKWQ